MAALKWAEYFCSSQSVYDKKWKLFTLKKFRSDEFKIIQILINAIKNIDEFSMSYYKKSLV